MSRSDPAGRGAVREIVEYALGAAVASCGLNESSVLAMMKLSDYVMRFIADAGVKHVFMLPGGGAMHLNDSLARCAGLDFVCNLHEQACAIAAEGYARVTNNLGVALVTTGPGGTNTVTGVPAAWLDSTPCLFLSGQVKRADLMGGRGVRQLGPQEVDIVSIVKTITKYAATVTIRQASATIWKRRSTRRPRAGKGPFGSTFPWTCRPHRSIPTAFPPSIPPSSRRRRARRCPPPSPSCSRGWKRPSGPCCWRAMGCGWATAAMPAGASSTP